MPIFMLYCTYKSLTHLCYPLSKETAFVSSLSRHNFTYWLTYFYLRVNTHLFSGFFWSQGGRVKRSVSGESFPGPGWCGEWTGSGRTRMVAMEDEGRCQRFRIGLLLHLVQLLTWYGTMGPRTYTAWDLRAWWVVLEGVWEEWAERVWWMCREVVMKGCSCEEAVEG